MNPNGWELNVAEGKARAVKHLRKAGYQVFAMVDNEPENLKAICKVDPKGEILLLHANTIFESKRKRLPAGSVSGKVYDLTELIEEKALPRHIQFVWHGVNDEANLRQFLGSTIQWPECDVRLDLTGKEIVLRHDSFEETPFTEEEELYHLKDILGAIKTFGKSIKLDLKENGSVLEETLKLIRRHNFDDSSLWFNAKTKDLGQRGFLSLRKEHPLAIIQCPIDDLASMILREPVRSKEILDRLKRWGINRFSLNWRTPHLRRVLDQMDRFGLEPNICKVPDLESFLKAVLLMPRSITADFNFPKWHYYGRGSGERLWHYEYAITNVSSGA